MCASVGALGFFFYLYILSGSNEFLLVFLFVSVFYFILFFKTLHNLFLWTTLELLVIFCACLHGFDGCE